MLFLKSTWLTSQVEEGGYVHFKSSVMGRNKDRYLCTKHKWVYISAFELEVSFSNVFSPQSFISICISWIHDKWSHSTFEIKFIETFRDTLRSNQWCVCSTLVLGWKLTLTVVNLSFKLNVLYKSDYRNIWFEIQLLKKRERANITLQ